MEKNRNRICETSDGTTLHEQISWNDSWKFNVSKAAWWGVMKGIKGVRQKTPGRTQLSFAHLGTVVLDFKCHLNNWSRTHIESVVGEDQVLAPISSFLIPSCFGPTLCYLDLLPSYNIKFCRVQGEETPKFPPPKMIFR